MNDTITAYERCYKPFKVKDWYTIANGADEARAIGREEKITLPVTATEKVGKLQQQQQQQQQQSIRLYTVKHYILAAS